MRIVFFGDSLTQGTFGVSYVNKVAAALRGHHFYNEGINGDTSLNLYRRVDRDVIAKEPDAALVMIGINDAVSHGEPSSRLYYRLVKRVAGGQVSPIAFRENLRAVISRLQINQIRVWVALPPVEHSPPVVDALRQMNAYALKLCQEMGVPTLDLMTVIAPAEIPPRPAQSLVASMTRNLTRYINPARDYEGWRRAGGYTYTFDGIHLTEPGAQRFAEEITRFLREQGVDG
jgi:lysophospholipase L1-like esterase